MKHVRQLSPEQLDELKQAYLFDLVAGAPLSYGELADADNIPDAVIYDYYAGIDFTDDDFFCTTGNTEV